MLRGLATVNYYADDLEAAKRWYAELLGVEPYFERPGYSEFRIGDHEDELGLIDRRYAPEEAASTPGGAIVHWHVDDVHGAVERAIALGARPYAPVTEFGDGFVAGAVVDPFGNVLGLMFNQHWLDGVAGR